MFFELYSKKISPVKKVVLQSTYTKLQSSDAVSNGVLCRTSEFKVFDNKDLLNQFHSSDFAIANLIAVGAYKESPVIMSNSSDMSVVDSFEKSFTTFEKALKDAPKES